jgi:ArsR family transcriptional regulator, cadmium/lead-responsive transcriptional repressor
MSSSEIQYLDREDPKAFLPRVKLLRGFADQSRLAILQALRNGPLSVGEIVEATHLSQPNASNHLRCLSECGLVVGEQHGRHVHYQLTDPRTARLLELLDEILTSVAVGVKDCQNY